MTKHGLNAQMTNMRSEIYFSSFGFRHSFDLRSSTLVISLTLAALSLFAEPPPSAKDILASVRMMESLQEIDLQGQLRQDNIVIPFHLVQIGPLIRYSFANPDEVLQLRLGEKSSRLDLVTGEGTEQFAGLEAQAKNSRYRCDLRGSGVQISLLAGRARFR